MRCNFYVHLTFYFVFLQRFRYSTRRSFCIHKERERESSNFDCNIVVVVTEHFVMQCTWIYVLKRHRPVDKQTIVDIITRQLLVNRLKMRWFDSDILQSFSVFSFLYFLLWFFFFEFLRNIEEHLSHIWFLYLSWF